LINGQTTFINGQTTLINGQTTFINGQSTLTTGRTTLTNGQKTLINGQTTLITGQTTLTNGQTIAGEAGAGAKMKLVVNMIMSTMLSAFSEGLTLSEAVGLDASDVLDVVNSGAMACPMFELKGPNMQVRYTYTAMRSQRTHIELYTYTARSSHAVSAMCVCM
jgi:6-phosphogluconate dehydrogenase (decarboxylating)